MRCPFRFPFNTSVLLIARVIAQARALVLTGALVLALPALAQAAEEATAVAVMPFRDLTGAKGAVGDAIRESVTTDLRGVRGIRVVERGEIDRVLAEQKLQGAQMDQDPLATVRIGKLIGADLICVGAYQQVGRRVRLTARFVRTQTGEVVGTAKVDGNVSDFLALQDKVTVELLRSAKLAPKVVARVARRAPRPKLRSLRAVELYGKSLTETKEPMKRALLREAVIAEPAYSYAKDALVEIEEKLRAYEARMEAARRAQAQKAHDAFDAATTPGERLMQAPRLAGILREARRFNEAQRMWSTLVQELSSSKDPEDQQKVPWAWQQALLALDPLGRHDELFDGGQKMLARYPEAPEFAVVKTVMERIIEERRKAEAEQIPPDALLRSMHEERRWDLCEVAREYGRRKQREQARRLYLACLETGSGDPLEALRELVTVSMDLGDHVSAKGYLEQLEAQSPVAHQTVLDLVLARLAADE